MPVELTECTRYPEPIPGQLKQLGGELELPSRN